MSRLVGLAYELILSCLADVGGSPDQVQVWLRHLRQYRRHSKENV